MQSFIPKINLVNWCSTRKSGYIMYRGWTQTDYQNKHYNINQKDEETQDDRGRDGGTNFILRIKEQETCLTLQEHDDDDDDDDDESACQFHTLPGPVIGLLQAKLRYLPIQLYNLTL